jgi:hypothetical protein
MTQNSFTRTPVPPARSLDWVLIVSLSALPLLHPLFSVTGWAEAIGRPITHFVLVGVITALWVTVVVLSRAHRPVVTLVLAAALAAAGTTVLGLVIPVIRTGEARNLLDVWGAVASLTVTAMLFCAWGAASGLLAAGVQRLRGDDVNPA